MKNDQLWLFIDKVISDYMPDEDGEFNKEDSLDLSILSLLIKLKMRNLHEQSNENTIMQTEENFDYIYKELDQTIENNRVQFAEVLTLIQKTD